MISVEKIALIGRGRDEECPRRVVTEDEALRGMMANVLLQLVRDYAWMLMKGMISPANPFALSDSGEGWGRRTVNGRIVTVNGKHTCVNGPGGAMGMREVLSAITGGVLRSLCEFTGYAECRVRARLKAIHAEWLNGKTQAAARIRRK